MVSGTALKNLFINASKICSFVLYPAPQNYPYKVTGKSINTKKPVNINQILTKKYDIRVSFFMSKNHTNHQKFNKKSGKNVSSRYKLVTMMHQISAFALFLCVHIYTIFKINTTAGYCISRL